MLRETDRSALVRVNADQVIDRRDIPGDERLLDTLRDRLGLRSVKRGCNRGECGACTVLVNSRPVVSCLTLTARVRGQVETAEGLADQSVRLRRAFAQHGAFQCGFCTPGMIVTATALLRDGTPRDEAALRHELAGNICRCTGYQQIIDAIQAVRSQSTQDDGFEAGAQ
ncbi:(2Fe-2S)-binding protein [Streptosporangium sp. NPDC051022]|uniref:(2Fe-2S)-binding protein n=1 Tax=Streptosporangium sp. NPDC051022 TaxID=3155752 RepID=UPI00341CA793